MSKTTRLPSLSKKKRYISRYNEGGMVKKSPVVIKKIIATGDRFNNYKTRIS